MMNEQERPAERTELNDRHRVQRVINISVTIFIVVMYIGGIAAFAYLGHTHGGLNNGAGGSNSYGNLVALILFITIFGTFGITSIVSLNWRKKK